MSNTMLDDTRKRVTIVEGPRQIRAFDSYTGQLVGAATLTCSRYEPHRAGWHVTIGGADPSPPVFWRGLARQLLLHRAGNEILWRLAQACLTPDAAIAGEVGV